MTSGWTSIPSPCFATGFSPITLFRTAIVQLTLVQPHTDLNHHHVWNAHRFISELRIRKRERQPKPWKAEVNFHISIFQVNQSVFSSSPANRLQLSLSLSLSHSFSNGKTCELVRFLHDATSQCVSSTLTPAVSHCHTSSKKHFRFSTIPWVYATLIYLWLPPQVENMNESQWWLMCSSNSIRWQD